MTRKELEQVIAVLNNIKNRDSFVKEAICNVERDLVRREQQSKKQVENRNSGYEGF